ncbi:MAG: hypothetical protein TR69_WS6001000027 [candidate division WS6 bacterium OLB20]|uniref:Uncharacterized protein n=1 Tax=candidate division WS6 bacterium OLB20 TaxID=1617426 RepID=A0A136M113_9BACT|nr:MAG: hypothetical protein TR69_WS6001000027 [candidate division WS6 bacterium OLB20]
MNQLTPEQQALVNSYSREAGVPAGPFMDSAFDRFDTLQAVTEDRSSEKSVLTIGGGGISHHEPSWYPWLPRAALLRDAYVVNVDPARQSSLDLGQERYHAISGARADILTLLERRYHATLDELQKLLPAASTGFSLIIADRLLGGGSTAPELFARMIAEGSHAEALDQNRDRRLLSLRERIKQAASDLLAPGGILAIDGTILRAHNQHLYRIEGF